MIFGPKKIFVSIASFCDPLLRFTVENALQQATYPDRLTFGIVDQSENSIEDELLAIHPFISYLHIDPHHSRGTCWARSLAMSLYNDEHYFFQTDSHMVFEPGWDEDLITMLKKITDRSSNEKIILSMRPFAFEFEEDGSINRKKFTDQTLELIPQSHEVDLASPILTFDSVMKGNMDDVPGIQVAGAFIFARGSFVEAIPYDPYLYFHGEEQNISMRAFTHGWDIWHPNKTVMFHLYKKRNEDEAPLHWDTKFEEKRKRKWHELKKRADKRLAKLFMGGNLGVYGLGKDRTIGDYLKAAGLTIKQDNPAG